MKKIRIGLLVGILALGLEVGAAPNPITTLQQLKALVLQCANAPDSRPAQKAQALSAASGLGLEDSKALIKNSNDPVLLAQAFAKLSTAISATSSASVPSHASTSSALSLHAVPPKPRTSVSAASSVPVVAHVSGVFSPIVYPPTPDSQRLARQTAMNDTLHLIHQIKVNGNSYMAHSGVAYSIETDPPVFSISDSKETSWPQIPVRWRTVFSVVPQDTLDAAQQMILSGENPVILNMANRHHAGGTADIDASTAQEEQVCYRSTLLPILKRYESAKGTPFIPEMGALYIPQITVFKANGPAHRYGYLQAPFQVAVIASAAYNNRGPSQSHIDPRLGVPDAPSSPTVYANNTKEKIRSQLALALMFGHREIILGAYGCGAFNNSPADMVGFYADVLKEPRFKNQFKKVVFAVFEPNSSSYTNPASNFMQFKRIEHLNDPLYY